MDKKSVGPYIQWTTTQPLKKNKILLFEMAWIDLEAITLSEINQRKTHTI